MPRVQGQAGGRRVQKWMCIAFVDHLRLSSSLVYIIIECLVVWYICVVWCGCK